MHKSFLTAAVAGAAATLFANAPVVSDVEAPEAPYLAKAEISYTLSGVPGIVTFELQTNGVPVDCNYVSVSGDMNQLLQPGKHSFTWSSEADWPNHKDKKVEARIVVKAWSTNAPPDYMIVPLKAGSTEPIRYYAKAGDIPGGLTALKYKTDYLAMRLIHARGVIWEMGGHTGDTDVNSNEKLHLVALTDDYYIGVYPITLAQFAHTQTSGRTVFDALGKGDLATAYTTDSSDYGQTRPAAGPNPKYYTLGNGSDYYWPANAVELKVNTSWYFAKLRERTGLPRIYLPTSTQWEYACRAGTTTKFHNGSHTSIGTTGWCLENNADDPEWVEGMPHAVGLREPNAWNLYDMHGNVLEWCCDSSLGTTEQTADGTPLVDPPGAGTGESWRQRGGSFLLSQDACGAFDIAAANYGAASVAYGFRVTCPATVCK